MDPIVTTNDQINQVLLCEHCTCEEQQHQLLKCCCGGKHCDQTMRLCDCSKCIVHDHTQLFDICVVCNLAWKHSLCKANSGWNAFPSFFDGPACPSCSSNILLELVTDEDESDSVCDETLNNLKRTKTWKRIATGGKQTRRGTRIARLYNKYHVRRYVSRSIK